MAKDPERLNHFYTELANVHKKYFYNWRFLQFIHNFIDWIRTYKDNDGWMYEEEYILHLLDEFVRCQTREI